MPIKCPRCNRNMLEMGNLNNIVYTSDPPQWDEVFVCHVCRVKKIVRVRLKQANKLDWLSLYEEV